MSYRSYLQIIQKSIHHTPIPLYHIQKHLREPYTQTINKCVHLDEFIHTQAFGRIPVRGDVRHEVDPEDGQTPGITSGRCALGGSTPGHHAGLIFPGVPYHARNRTS